MTDSFGYFNVTFLLDTCEERNGKVKKQTKNNKTKTKDYPALEYPIHKADWDLDKEMLVMNQTGNTNLKRLVKLRASRRNKIAHDPG